MTSKFNCLQICAPFIVKSAKWSFPARHQLVTSQVANPKTIARTNNTWVEQVTSRRTSWRQRQSVATKFRSHWREHSWMQRRNISRSKVFGVLLLAWQGWFGHSKIECGFNMKWLHVCFQIILMSQIEHWTIFSDYLLTRHHHAHSSFNKRQQFILRIAG